MRTSNGPESARTRIGHSESAWEFKDSRPVWGRPNEFTVTRIPKARLQVRGVATAYLDMGPRGGTPVLLLHDGGWGADALTSFGPLIPLLADTRRVIAPDLLGYGDSAKVVFFDQSRYGFRINHLAAFLRALGVTEKVEVVGVSFGGSIALRALTDHPKALPISSVISISGTGGPYRIMEAFQEISSFEGKSEEMERILATLMDPESPSFSSQLKRRMANVRIPGHFESLEAARISRPLGWPSVRVQEDYVERLQSTSQPVLFVEGRKDPLLERGWSKKLKAIVRNGEAVEIDGRHCPNLDQPEQLATLLLEFLEACEENHKRSSIL
jgi:pimeloyl-ACP methyl ester carboxylesterase